jgi:hypothetical protein
MSRPVSSKCHGGQTSVNERRSIVQPTVEKKQDGVPRASSLARLWLSRTPLVPPKIFKPVRRQLRITDRVLDVAVAKPCLECPRIVASVCQGEAAGVSEHVWVDRKRHPGPLAEARDQCVEALGRHRAAALGREHIRARWLFALQTAQGTELITLDRMHAWCVPDVRCQRGSPSTSCAVLQSRQFPAQAGDARTDQDPMGKWIATSALAE